MNAGLGSLTYLKTQLLAEALREGTAYDAALTAIGQGVAAQFEKHCNRYFARTVSDTFTTSADRPHLYLPRLPVESIASVALKSDPTTGFVTQASSAIINSNLESGFVYFGGELGAYWEQIRLTYTGGYWFDQTEDASDSLPAGATALPESLRLAWILQCKKVWEVSDPLGGHIVPSKENLQLVGLSLAGLELVPQAKDILHGFIRYALT